MARLHTVGFEINDVDAEPRGTGSTTVATAAAARTGTYGCRNISADMAATFVLNRAYFLRTYFRKTNNPSVVNWVLAGTTAAAAHYGIRLETDGTLTLRDTAGTQIGSASAALGNNTWYRIEMKFIIVSGAGADDTLEGMVDGASFASTSAATLDTAIPNSLSIGALFTGITSSDTDDIALNDDQGASQNSWPGEGKIISLFPASQNQRGSWTGGAGGTGDLTTTIDNRPPIGTSAETDSTQMESADSSGDNATDEYRTNLTTYSAGGLTASETITVLQPYLDHAEDVTTNTKTGSFGLQSNPSQTYATFTFGNNAGALAAWAGNWFTSAGNPVYSPSVTLGSAPVLAWRKTDTGTRVASVDAAWLNVEYVSAATYQPRHGFVDHANPGVLMQGIRRAWHRRRDGIFVPEYAI
jgi:hypothetical protein